jgi:hypothetical protein
MGPAGAGEKKKKDAEKMDEEPEKKPRVVHSQTVNPVSSQRMEEEKKKIAPNSQEVLPKEKPKPTLSESILKYLTKPFSTTTNSQPNPSPLKTDRDHMLLSLEERIKLREERGE